MKKLKKMILSSKADKIDKTVNRIVGSSEDLRIIIDPEFKSLLMPLQQDEYKNLESDIIQNGCRDALQLWNNILIDGHNRYEICKKYNFRFRTIEKKFKDREEVKLYIYRNQLSRRNLTDVQRIEIAKHIEAILKPRAKDNQGRRTDISLNLDKSSKIDVLKEVAKNAGVSRATVAKYNVIEKKGSQEIKERLKSGKISIHKAFKESLEREQIKAIKFNIESDIVSYLQKYSERNKIKMIELLEKTIKILRKMIVNNRKR